MASEWYYAKADERFGPVSSELLQQLAGRGELLPSDLVWREGMSGWRSASRVVGLFSESVSSSPPPLPVSPGVVISEVTKDAVQRVRDYAASDEAKAKVEQAKKVVVGISAKVGETVEGAAKRAKSYVNSDETKRTIEHAHQVVSAIGGKAADVAKTTFVVGEWNWRENPLVIGLSLFFCFPVGLLFVWTHSRWSKNVKMVWTAAVVLIFGAIGSLTEDTDKKKLQSKPVVDATAEQTHAKGSAVKEGGPKTTTKSPSVIQVDRHGRVRYLSVPSGGTLPEIREGEILIMGNLFLLRLCKDPSGGGLVSLGYNKNTAEFSISLSSPYSGEAESGAVESVINFGEIQLRSTLVGGRAIGKCVGIFKINNSQLGSIAAYRGPVSLSVSGGRVPLFAMNEALSQSVGRLRHLSQNATPPLDGSTVPPLGPTASEATSDRSGQTANNTSRETSPTMTRTKGPLVYSEGYIQQLKLKYRAGFSDEAIGDMVRTDAQVVNLTRPVRVTILERLPDYTIVRIEENRLDLRSRAIDKGRIMYIPNSQNW